MQSNVNTIRDLLADKYLKEEYTTDKTGVKTVELIGASFIADEDIIFGSLNAEYIQHELDWYLSQSLNVNDIPGKVPTIWKAVATPDGLINSNYGYLVYNSANGNQYKNTVDELLRNPDSRRAIMIYTRPSMHTDWCTDGMSDFICTNAVQFLIRDGRCHAVLQMRSNDAWAGYRNDYAWQKYVLSRLVNDLKSHGKEVEVGTITWQVGSLHLYERQFYLLDHYIATDRTEFDITLQDYKRQYN
jgi:thymidylate synthase